MHSKGQALSSPLRTISLAIIAVFVITLALIPAFAQNSVPPTAVQAAKMPQFASRLGHPAQRRLPPPKSQVFARAKAHRGPLDSNDIYDNGPINGNTDAWDINFGFIVSDTFNVANAQTIITGMTFGAWLFPGDTVTSVEVSITSSENGGTSYFDQTVNFTQGSCTGNNNFGFNVCTETASFTGPTLNAGTYWVNLQNANTTAGNPVYWDENSGIACTGAGCPSSASENSVGSIPSGSFTILGSATTTTTTNCFYCPPPCEGPESVHDFTGGTDGSSPNGVTGEPPANLYGTANGGYGSAFQLSQAGSGWILNSLYDFAGGNDGSGPSMPIIGPNGSLYGSARSCNQQSCSIAFNLTPQPTACLTAMCPWNKTVLYQFNDIAGVSAIDEVGNLYGSDYSGGAQGLGAVFELTPSMGFWTKTILYSFTGGNDGHGPGVVLLGRDGNLYGRAQGGQYGDGVVFQLVRSSGWTENTIFAIPEPNYAFTIFGDLVGDGSGNFYFAYAHYRTDQNGFYVDAIVDKLFFVNGQWNIRQAFYIDPGTWNSGVDLYDLAADTRGVYAGADAYCVESCEPPPLPVLLFVRIYKNGDQWIDLGRYFGPNGPMVSDSLGYIYGASAGCGAYGAGSIWKWRPGSDLDRNSIASPPRASRDRRPESP